MFSEQGTVEALPLRKKIFPSEFIGEFKVAVCGSFPLSNAEERQNMSFEVRWYSGINVALCRIISA